MHCGSLWSVVLSVKVSLCVILAHTRLNFEENTCFELTFILYLLVYTLLYFTLFICCCSVFYCSKCTDENPGPVGKKCQCDTAGESFSTSDEVVAPPLPSKITASDPILCQLRVLGEKVDSMDKRVQEQGSSHVNLPHNRSHINLDHSMVSVGIDTSSKSSESVVPSMECLRSKDVWQISNI